MCAMAESSFPSEESDSDMETLKEALRAQQQLLQKLYFELDEEREASSSATSEAMSMILRLQGEKAQMKMEASQYKREAEEKLCLAEESLAIYEDLMYQKEMEIACLEFQVQAYRYKLLAMGCTDLSIPESRFPECLQQQRSEPVITEIGVHRNFKRHDSLPSISLKDGFPRKNAIERERSATPGSELIPTIEEVTNEDTEVNFLSLDLEKKTGTSDLNVYWERIRKLDEQVKEISDGKILRRANSTSYRNRPLRSCSLPPPAPDQEDSRLSTSPPVDGISTSFDQDKYPKNFVEKNAASNAISSSSILDKFEVPQNNENWKARGIKEIDQKNLILVGEKRYRKPVSEENFEFHVKDKTEFVRKVPLCPKHKDKSSKQKQKERTGIEPQFSLPSTSNTASECEVDIQRLRQRIERLESKESSARQEISLEGEPGLMMLKKILDQLNTLQSELRNHTSKKSSQLDDPRIRSLSEAMLHFWL